MDYVIAGLGNPGDKYKNTRHNAGRIVLEHIRGANDFSEWRKDGVARAMVSKGEIEGNFVTLVLPETFMNESGKSISTFISSEKCSDSLIVIYDDLDLGIGDIKMSFGKSSGGHKGLESVINVFNNKDFARIRVGISPKSFFGNLKKPKGDANVTKFVLGRFSGGEMKKVKELSREADKMINALIKKGREYAMNHYN
ncbi:MAG: aminoacyl-tRNA hydrolase [Candidatus Pacebacteria bacterium]|jgi:PTH1 family peptidyl-tRNA hydrolase|nr:aminoacyl-tRNA hydrolase [bacterium]MDP6527521.1 aminoacyl-tRNA hydrolase [Candidatus Paceibacterota bacterium]MDP6659876.1 aminoacyl-tRNA hydrolase [Candidatus Paceibacterota bacterium]|tara:strand:+ start:24769 stop:25359 length:591 start_codon:yes stop_codon:yes gene_type:complete